jgi:hypothetical protein
MMIAAYRAARLSQRPVLRTDLHPASSVNGPAGSARLDDPSDTVRGGSAPFQPSGSVFASLMNGQAPIATEAPVQTVASPVPTPPEPAVKPVAPKPTLAEMGFGQGMLLRLSQIGLRTVADLARADPADLRAALGDSSRLVDVDAWVIRARHVLLGTAGRA